jgi:hypothetical protein
MALKVFNSSDLVRHIYSFGDPEHRRMTREVCEQLQPNPDQFLDDFFLRRCQEPEYLHYRYTIQDFVEEIDKKRICRYMRNFKRCYCCERHNRNKPILHEGRLTVCEGTVTERIGESGRLEDICFCICRHTSRRIIPTILERHIL